MKSLKPTRLPTRRREIQVTKSRLAKVVHDEQVPGMLGRLADHNATKVRVSVTNKTPPLRRIVKISKNLMVERDQTPDQGFAREKPVPHHHRPRTINQLHKKWRFNG